MAMSMQAQLSVFKYLVTQKMKGVEKYPLVMMLEPLFACNLECAGCGKIQYPTDILRKRMTPQEVFDAVEECGAPIVSIADFAWALHRAGESGPLNANVTRAGKAQSLVLNLPTGWRSKADISKRVGTWPMRAMAFGGMVLTDLTDEERLTRSLSKDKLGLFVKGLGQYGKHATAKNAGFRKDDVLVELNGKSARITEGELIGQLLQTTKPGEKLKATVLRGDQRVELLLPMQ